MLAMLSLCGVMVFSNGLEDSDVFTVSADNEYIFVDLKKNFWQANSFCNIAFGSTLATIASFEEDKIISDLCDNSNAGKVSCWFGLTKYFDDNFKWIDPFYSNFNHTNDYTNFDNTKNRRDCVTSTYCEHNTNNTKRLWRTKACDFVYTFVCNYKYYNENDTSLLLYNSNKFNFTLAGHDTDYIFIDEPESDTTYFESNTYCNIYAGTTLYTGNFTQFKTATDIFGLTGKELFDLWAKQRFADDSNQVTYCPDFKRIILDEYRIYVGLTRFWSKNEWTLMSSPYMNNFNNGGSQECASLKFWVNDNDCDNTWYAGLTDIDCVRMSDNDLHSWMCNGNNIDSGHSIMNFDVSINDNFISQFVDYTSNSNPDWECECYDNGCPDYHNSGYNRMVELYSVICTYEVAWFYEYNFISESDMFLIAFQALFDVISVYILSHFLSFWVKFWFDVCLKQWKSKENKNKNKNKHKNKDDKKEKKSCKKKCSNNCKTCLRKLKLNGSKIVFLLQVILSIVTIVRFIMEINNYYVAESEHMQLFRLDTLPSMEKFFCLASLRLSILMYDNLLPLTMIGAISIIDTVIVLIVIIGICIGSVCCSCCWCCCYIGHYWGASCPKVNEQENTEDYARSGDDDCCAGIQCCCSYGEWNEVDCGHRCYYICCGSLFLMPVCVVFYIILILFAVIGICVSILGLIVWLILASTVLVLLSLFFIFLTWIICFKCCSDKVSVVHIYYIILKRFNDNWGNVADRVVEAQVKEEIELVDLYAGTKTENIDKDDSKLVKQMSTLTMKEDKWNKFYDIFRKQSRIFTAFSPLLIMLLSTMSFAGWYFAGNMHAVGTNKIGNNEAIAPNWGIVELSWKAIIPFWEMLYIENTRNVIRFFTYDIWNLNFSQLFDFWGEFKNFKFSILFWKFVLWFLARFLS